MHSLEALRYSRTHKHTGRRAHTHHFHVDRMREQSGHSNHRQNTESVHTCFLSPILTQRYSHSPTHNWNPVIYLFDSIGSMNQEQMYTLILSSWFYVSNFVFSCSQNPPLYRQKLITPIYFYYSLHSLPPFYCEGIYVISSYKNRITGVALRTLMWVHFVRWRGHMRFE